MQRLNCAIRRLLAKRSYYTYVNEPAMPLKGKEPKWCDKPEDVFEKLDSGQTVFASGAAATPIDLLHHMTEVAKKKQLKGIKVCGAAVFKPRKCIVWSLPKSIFLPKNYVATYPADLYYLSSK